MNTMRIQRTAAVLGLAAITILPLTQPSFAQKVFSRQQIVKQLQVSPNAKLKLRKKAGFRRAPQQNEQVFVKRRAPQPVNDNVVIRRAPQPENDNVAFRRAPQPENDNVVFRRAPQPENNNVQQFRAPQPSDVGVAKRRAPQPVSRPPQSEDIRLADNGRRGIEVRPAELEEVVAHSNYPDAGRIDLEILFDYDSAEISPKSVRQLVELGEALNDPELGDGRFVIAGHTDATGSAGYNANLSLRRARAVSEFLVNFTGVNPRRLAVEGYGEELLKYPDAPESGQNRRVEIINLGPAG